MAKVKYPALCDLCRQPLEIGGFFIETEQGRKNFCCGGCQSIYRLLYENDKNKSHPASNNLSVNATKINNEDK